MATCNQELLIGENLEEQSLEFESLLSIFGEEMKVITPEKEFLIDISIHSSESLELLLTTPKLADSEAPPPPPHLTRSTSTKPALVTHLPPVSLYVRYHDNYPSTDPPTFHLSARWLNERHLKIISEKLRLLFTPGWPTVYNWVTYISSDMLAEIEEEEGGGGGGRGTQGEPPTSSRHLFVRSISEFNDVEEYDKFENHKQFLADKHLCGVCFEEKYGDHYVEKCDECKDESILFCKDCVREHCETLLAEGRVTNFSCLSTDCSKALSDTLVQSLLTPDKFQRYLELREQVSLDSIPGMVFCPRSACGSRIISDPQSDLALCPQCGFPFCKRCRQTWHGIEECAFIEKAKEVEVEVEDTEIEDTEIEDKKSKARDEQRRLEELQSIIWMQSHRNVRGCPTCSTFIQKIGGCNKMSCWKCGSSFCWICMQKISGYNHFELQSSCNLFRDEDYLPPEPEQEDKEATDATKDVQQIVKVTVLENLLESACPRCGLIEQKLGKRNWVKCRRCQMPFCLQCREPCYGRYHFSEYGCKEFTTFREDLDNFRKDQKEENEESTED